MSDVASALRVSNKEERTIQGRDRDYGNVLWKLPHLLDLSYVELEDRNLEIKQERLNGTSSEDMQDRIISYLQGETGIKSVMLCFTDLEGRLQALDYDKKFLIGAHDNLTFDGSSINGFSQLSQSDLRLKIDWTTFRWVPSDLFGTGKVLVFANVCNEDGTHYKSDFRSSLMDLCSELRDKGMVVNVAPEIEGFLFAGEKAEQVFHESVGFELATMSGYYNSLPQDTLRLFMDKLAEVKRALGFENEKDHPEVAPAQFELNFKYSVALDTADQIQLYKLLARQIAKSMGYTASFLPKPLPNLNGSGMHTNMSISKDGVNVFYDADGENNLSEFARKFVTGVLYYANDLCLIMNSSVNSYRRLDPNYEAPNEIKTSSIDRGSMVRIPMGNAKSARMEVRTVAPDANPYLTIFTLIKAGMKGIDATGEELDDMMKNVYEGEVQKLPADIFSAIELFEKSEFMKETMGEDHHRKYLGLKLDTANRSPRDLGNTVKNGEVLYHHEVTNQLLWDSF